MELTAHTIYQKQYNFFGKTQTQLKKIKSVWLFIPTL